MAFEYRKIRIELENGDPINADECPLLNAHAKEGWEPISTPSYVTLAPRVHGAKARCFAVVIQRRLVLDDVAGKQSVAIMEGEGLEVKAES